MARTLYNFSVSVSVQDLLQKLKSNRSEHQSNYETALKGYAIRLQDISNDLVLDIKEKGALSLHLKPIQHLRKPENYTEVYDKLISMLEMSVDEDIEIDSSQYGCWVENRWDWTESWTIANTGYIETATALNQ